MNNYRIYAFLDDDGVVRDIRICKDLEEADLLISLIYAYGRSVNVGNIYVEIDDVYIDGSFYKIEENGNKTIRRPIITDQARLNNMNQIINRLKTRIEYLEDRLNIEGKSYEQ